MKRAPSKNPEPAQALALHFSPNHREAIGREWTFYTKNLIPTITFNRALLPFRHLVTIVGVILHFNSPAIRNPSCGFPAFAESIFTFDLLPMFVIS